MLLKLEIGTLSVANAARFTLSIPMNKQMYATIATQTVGVVSTSVVQNGASTPKGRACFRHRNFAVERYQFGAKRTSFTLPANARLGSKAVTGKGKSHVC
jgi:hypothetical protein